MVLVDDGAPDRLDDVQGLGLGAAHADRLGVVDERAQARRRAVEVGAAWVDLQEHEVAPVPLGVGEAPGDLPVRADDHRRHAGEGHAGHPPRGRSGALRPGEGGAEPGRRHAEA